MDAISRRKTRGETIRGQTVENAPGAGVGIVGFSDLTLERVVIRNTSGGFILRRGRNLVLRQCETDRVEGDGIYLTGVAGSLLENNKIGAASGKAADCIQYAYENNDRNISSDAVIRGNLLLQSPESASRKGGLVCVMTKGYLVEYNFIGGKNFSFGSSGDDAVVRSNVMRDGRMQGYSFGYAVSDQKAHERHHVYDNLIENNMRGICLTGFADEGKALRKDMNIHDNVISDCRIGFLADRPWTGSFRRNVFVKCSEDILLRGCGCSTSGDIGENYRNDGSFLNVTPPEIRVGPGGSVSVSSGMWTSQPDEIRIQWRDGGIDIPGANRPSIAVKGGVELSCVLLARKKQNWMLAIAETAYDDFTPRAWEEGKLPWRRRYLRF